MRFILALFQPTTPGRYSIFILFNREEMLSSEFPLMYCLNISLTTQAAVSSTTICPTSYLYPKGIALIFTAFTPRFLVNFFFEF